ncbi:hypothetical protein Tco_0120607, partial [Tanacetum coccineum]
LKLSSKLFANMKLNFEGQPLPLLAAMLSQAQAGEGAGVEINSLLLWEKLMLFKGPIYLSYPLSVKLMEKILTHKLEIDKDVVGNDMTTAEQLIRFIKNQIAAAQVSPV